MDAQTKMDLVKVLVDNVSDEFDDEDILHMMLEKKISVDVKPLSGEKQGLGQRAADAIARFAGSWTFILTFSVLLIGWMTVNTVLASRAFDAYPYILLNLVLSCIAAVQAPLIMMSQNRQEEKDRLRSENTYKINLKSEFILEDLHKKMDEILERLPEKRP